MWKKVSNPNLNSFGLLLSSGHNVQGWTMLAFHKDKRTIFLNYLLINFSIVLIQGGVCHK